MPFAKSTKLSAPIYSSYTFAPEKEVAAKGGKIEVNFDKTQAKFVKVIAVNNGIIPDGMPGAGSQSWLFVDEISVE